MKPDLIRIGQITIRFLLEGVDTGGALAMFEFTVPAGAKVPVPHFHKDYDETIYGLEGVIRFTVNGHALDIAAGESCFIPRGAVHGFDNLTPAAARGLAVITPGLLRPEFFIEIAALLNAGATAGAGGAPAGPPDLAAMKAIMLKHGLVPAPPTPPR